jgi:hypothetical protein
MARELEKAPTDWIEGLARAMKDESKVMWQLRDAMVHQRDSVAANDAEELDACVLEVGRTLLTLAEARKRRGAVMQYVTGEEELPLGQLEFFVGRPLPLGLETARAEMRLAAQAVAHEAVINRTVLQRAREAADAFLQELFSAISSPDAVYRPPESGGDGACSPGMMFNGTA